MPDNKFPEEVEILDSKYKMLYFDDASDVCIMKRYNKLKEVDFWTSEIRIFRGDSTEFEIWNRIWESLIEIFVEKLHIDDVVKDDLKERHMLLLSAGISCALMNNDLLSDREGFPKSLQIFNSVYEVMYYDKASQVDHVQRNSLFGQVDLWDSKIRIYKGRHSESSIWQTIWHEVIHTILDKLYLKLSEDEVFVDLMATAINGVLEYNGIFRKRFEKMGK